MVKFDIIEEHHETVKYMSRYIEKQKKYTFINIDEHSDMGVLKIKKEVCIDKDLEDIVYRQLNVGNFITCLFYFQWIETAIWVSNEGVENYQEFEVEENTLFNDISVVSYQTSKINGQGMKRIEAHLNSDVSSFIHDEVILSIDLDFFAADDICGETIKVEITQDAYDDFYRNKYNKIRTNLGIDATVLIDKSGKYYLEIMPANSVAPRVKNIENIDAKIAKLKEFLINNAINPAYVLICKSSITGYTDNVFATYILRKIMVLLESLYG